MSITGRYVAYANAFEETYVDDDWSRLARFFAPDVVYRPGVGGEIRGRDAVLAAMHESVDGWDRRFDARLMADLAPREVGNEVSISWTSTYRLAGAPDLVMSGTETATFEGDVITELSDVFDAGVADRAARWMDAHGPKLDT